MICYVYGPVMLKFNESTDLVEGKIGDSDVSLAFYQSIVYGDINGVPVEMRVLEDGSVDGKMGQAGFKLHYRNDRIVGCMPCIGPRELKEN